VPNLAKPSLRSAAGPGATRVINKVKGVNRVVTSKPPGMIERE